MVLRLSDLNTSREEFTSPKVGFITSTFNISVAESYVGIGTFELFKFSVGCLGPDNNIYYVPGGNEQTGYVLKLDTKTGTATSFGNFPNVNVTIGSTTYEDGADIGGLVCGKDGNLYTIPRNQRSVTKIDTTSQSLTVFSENFGGHQDDPYYLSPLQTKWSGGCLAPNGKIYGIPFSYGKVLVINPQTGTASSTEVTTGLTTSIGKWSGGVLGPDGNIYGIPYNATTVLKIDPTTNTAITFGTLSGGWTGGCLAPNGKIYATPFDGSRTRSVLKIDPIAGTATTFGSISTSYFSPAPQYLGWSDACLAANGKIYSSPKGGTGILEINPENDTVSVIGVGSLPPLGQYVINYLRWGSFILSPDGKMYAAPSTETKILVFGEVSNQEPADWLLSPYQNKGL